MYRVPMEALNHHHLFHFWTVVREGGVTRASERLNVSQPTVSGQLRELEEVLGEKLLARSGRTVVLTDIGRTVYRYADQMIGLDRELLEAVKGRPTRPERLAVGVAMVVPKLVAYQMLEPALRLPEAIQLDCVQDRPERLLAELAIYGLDVVLADAPAPPAVKVRAYSHLLGECGVSVFGAERLAAAHRRRFPRSLDGAPFLLPSEDSALRFSLEEWFEKQKIRPRVVGTFQDSALLDAFGQAGAGLFAMPAAIEHEVRRQYRVRLVGRLDSVRQRFYAITVERKLRHSAVIAISERARALFG
jgi:LysR family transcriptional regulator, transcriptional activator of nhaA